MQKELSYAEAIAEVEQIVAKFSNGQMDVDTMAADVKRATELIALCKARLAKAEADVAEILKTE
ncbi:MAG: exodeoxyribonuclease VII small subunit [Rikenellaceae bacterium]|jgi:exodeoxyribonuclease VII small subunit|nr:exodeoxyribonuclease VII small subunit [Rikenellaceae bacterium]MBR2332826.1 exodeoxyribonuclease VII small subunit [Rikenellaceae bacterium]MBR2443394.1 exodeoxyribonuclease VII small subunit [Rikenellaceae bacterium]